MPRSTPTRRRQRRGTNEMNDVARLMKSKRTNEKTKQNYKSKINVMTEWLRQHAPATLSVSGTIQIPRPPTTQNREEREAYEKEMEVFRPSVVNFFGSLSIKAAVLLEASNDEAPELPKPMSISSVKGYRSALVDLHRMHQLTIDADLDNELNEILDGYEKVICSLKQGDKMAINEGKRHLKWDGYSLLAETFMKMAPPEHTRGQSWLAPIFAWSFLVVMWNLMSRSESVDTLMLQHVDWDGGALTIEEQGHKGDQNGEFKYAKHVYANPQQPSWLFNSFLSLVDCMESNNFSPVPIVMIDLDISCAVCFLVWMRMKNNVSVVLLKILVRTAYEKEVAHLRLDKCVNQRPYQFF